jgi:hypothetical protein
MSTAGFPLRVKVGDTIRECSLHSSTASIHVRFLSMLLRIQGIHGRPVALRGDGRTRRALKVTEANGIVTDMIHPPSSGWSSDVVYELVVKKEEEEGEEGEDAEDAEENRAND